jgi:hypothetical protein
MALSRPPRRALLYLRLRQRLDRARPSAEVYNIVDNDAAEVTGSSRPRALPLWFLRLAAPYAAAFLSTRLNVSNEKAKNELE